MPGWRDEFRADAVIHLGKHGTLEWLPGKALALSARMLSRRRCCGPLPHLYPFIVNDPGEGTQAKRRAQAVIVDHLTPPLTRAGSYGLPAELERLIDEYYEAAQRRPAPRRRRSPRRSWSCARAAGLDRRLRHRARRRADDRRLRKLDGFLCELKELQIRDGLHVFGASPRASGWRHCCVALARAAARRAAARHVAAARARRRSRSRLSIPLDCGLDSAAASPGPSGPRPDSVLAPAERRRAGAPPATRSSGWKPWRCGWSPARPQPEPALERRPAPCSTGSSATLRPAVAACGAAEIAGLLAGLDGRFVPPGPSGAPSRGRPEVLPTGRNFYSLDTRAVPTPAAWQLGWKSAALLVERHAPGARRLSARGSRCRPGAPPTCAPAATTSPRRWR